MAMVLINETPTEVGSGADEIIRLRAENAALKAELAAAQVDAKRYRWLRLSMILDMPEFKRVRESFGCEEYFDAAIDDAIAKENQNAK